MTTLGPSSPLDSWTAALARPAISPAGGSAAAIAGATAAALIAMVAGLTAERERQAAFHMEARRMLDEAEHLRQECLELAAEDARALTAFVEALKLPSTPDEARETRETAKHVTLAGAARVQIDVLHRAARIAEMGEQVAIISPPSAVGDAATATFLATAAARSAYWAARSDLKEESELGRALLNRAETAQQRLQQLLMERLS